MIKFILEIIIWNFFIKRDSMNKMLKFYVALMMLPFGLQARTILPEALANQINAAPNIESIAKTIATDAQWSALTGDEAGTALIVKELARKFNVSEALAAGYLNTPSALTLLENLAGKNRNQDAVHQTFLETLEAYNGSPESQALITQMLKYEPMLPEPLNKLDVADGKSLQTGASTRRFLMGFGIYRVINDNQGTNLKTRDTTFGNLKNSPQHEDKGKAYANAGTTSAHSTTLTMQPDGKILAAGVADEYKLVLARFTADGQLDTSFAQGKGVEVIPVGKDPRSQNTQYTNPRSIIIQKNGNIVVYGRFADVHGQFLFVALFDANGKSLGDPIVFKDSQIK